MNRIWIALKKFSQYYPAIIFVVALLILPIMDFLDIEPESFNSKVIDQVKIFDFPESETARARIRYSTLFASTTIFSLIVLATVLRALLRSKRRVKAVSVHFSKFACDFSASISANMSRLQELERVTATLSDEQIRHNQKTYDKITESTYDFFKTVCNFLSVIARVYTGRSCAVSIKYFSSHSGIISPGARDGNSASGRGFVDQKYKEKSRLYSYNSIFRDIVDKGESHKIFNDINEAERRGEYENHSNDSRKELFNRCLVFPICQLKRNHRSV